MHRHIGEDPPPGPVKDVCALELKINETDGKLTILDGEVTRLSRLIEEELTARENEQP